MIVCLVTKMWRKWESERAVFNRAMGDNGAAVMAWRHILGCDSRIGREWGSG